MFKELDRILAFVLLMTLFSLWITVCIQGIASLLNLRGRNLAAGLVETFRVLADRVGMAGEGLLPHDAEHLARYLLTRRGLSDRPGARGALGDPAEDRMPMGHLAGVVRPEELFAAVHELARRGGTAREVECAVRLLEALGLEGANGARLEQGYARFRFWFEANQARARQWFTAQTRRVAVGLAFAVALGFQLDAVEIYRQVKASGGEKESSAVAGMESIVQQGAGVPFSKHLRDADWVDQALQGVGFEILPEGFWRWPGEPGRGFAGHLAGMLMSAGLLTLGAPFWFNLLKRMTSLRSALAEEMDQRTPKRREPSGMPPVRVPGGV